jgi:hypothetical protein
VLLDLTYASIPNPGCGLQLLFRLIFFLAPAVMALLSRVRKASSGARAGFKRVLTALYACSIEIW